MDINRIDAYLQGASLDGYQEFGAHFSHEYEPGWRTVYGLCAECLAGHVDRVV